MIVKREKAKLPAAESEAYGRKSAGYAKAAEKRKKEEIWRFMWEIL